MLLSQAGYGGSLLLSSRRTSLTKTSVASVADFFCPKWRSKKQRLAFQTFPLTSPVPHKARGACGHKRGQQKTRLFLSGFVEFIGGLFPAGSFPYCIVEFVTIDVARCFFHDYLALLRSACNATDTLNGVGIAVVKNDLNRSI